MTWKTRSFWAAAVVICAAATAPVVRAQGPASAAPAGKHKTVGAALQGDQDGVQVTSLQPGAPAEKAGLRVGDQVISVQGIAIFELDQATLRTMADTAKSIIFVVMRDGQKKTFEVVPEYASAPVAPAKRDSSRQPPSR